MKDHIRSRSNSRSPDSISPVRSKSKGRLITISQRKVQENVEDEEEESKMLVQCEEASDVEYVKDEDGNIVPADSRR
jgi:hypothetical protein